MKLDLDILTGYGRVHNLTGKPRGLAARQELRIAELDRLDQPVHVVIPAHVYAISSSFFLGLFSGSLDHLGSREAFLEHYRFDVPAETADLMWRQIEDAITSWRVSSRVLEVA